MKIRNTLVIATLAASAGAARADYCPPHVSDFDSWGWTQSSQSGDAWMTPIVCSSNAHRQAVVDLVKADLGLGENWDYWDDILPDAANCNPDSWAGRLVNGAYAAQYIGENRDNDTFTHFACPDGILPDGSTVKFWLSQYVAYYVSEEGFDWECLADGDNAGGSDGYTYASNPSGNSALSLYYPWFWNKTVVDRASTLVHESTHEFAGHISNSACSNGASCDDVFMNANAQSFQVVFDAQAVDAYQREPGSRDLKIVNFGNDVCGYLPLLPDQERFSLVQVMQNKLKTCFQTVPPKSQWPASAFIDNVSGTIYDLASEPNGQDGTAYRIDVTNGAMWPCGKVCNPNDYVFNPNGNSGSRACNEAYQPGNAQVNADNRARCNSLNAQVAAGVTPAQHAALKSQAISMKSCISGFSDQYLDQVCTETMAGAHTVADIDQHWGIPDSYGYAYDAEEAIHACQARFCAAQPVDAWRQQAQAACFEWDDPAGCLPLACGDLAAIAADKGRDSFQYLDAVVCRASELARDFSGLTDKVTGCQAGFEDCLIHERYEAGWQAQLQGGECWSANLGAVDPLYTNRRLQIGTMSAERYAASDRGPGLLRSQCAQEEMECEALQAALHALAAKLAHEAASQRPIWKGPPLPDPWERLAGRFDRELAQSMSDLGAELADPQAPAAVPLARDLRIRRAAAMPEARVALSELIGRDTWFSAGGARFGQGVFSPQSLQRFGGAAPEHDAYGAPTAGFEPEIQALQTLAQRLDSREWQSEVALVTRLSATTYYDHMVALLNARTAQDVLAAHDALRADLARLRQ
jgi:hypothetical protein